MGRNLEEMEEDQGGSDGEENTMEVTYGEINVEEGMVGGYECPNFIFSEEEKKRIQRPWRRGVIVKLLGRKIGYKALESRLNQMWVKRWVISIIDWSNDYYLVAFSHDDDKKAALANGPWFIYDHYLTVKDWRPNFQSESDTIDEVAVWVRISGLPIEYYDPRALSEFGNKIGRTIKVDKTTIKQERGKYARVCVAVNLAKPLLAMFRIEGSSYKVEYEGLHLLCLVCGRYGHYKEGCAYAGNRKENEVMTGEGTSGHAEASNGGYSSVPTDKEGPWKVVQKPRRNKKSVDGRKNNGPIRINDLSKTSGSRFLVLDSGDSEFGIDC
ncbi:uncharacterized protein LOC131650313 [Vicia villosa]|uniref:uncharacterized protein LOC131650313 n=1 Tax=Vicia villosa TaxID=3911 RepID=UPI00273B457E|nr:uncharacterized protein LOC131650313 [Vicia villosa]